MRQILFLFKIVTNQWNQTSYGILNAGFGKSSIRIRKNVIDGLEIAKLEGTVFATAFFLSITILHELVHYCRYNKKLKKDTYEYGKGFELNSIGFSVELDNVGKKYLEYKKYFETLKNVYRKQKIVQ